MFCRKIETEIITFSAHNYQTKTNQTTLCAVLSLNIFFSVERLEIGSKSQSILTLIVFNNSKFLLSPLTNNSKELEKCALYHFLLDKQLSGDFSTKCCC